MRNGVPDCRSQANDWASVVADVGPCPPARFSDLLVWLLDLSESAEPLPERDRVEIRTAAADHLARITDDDEAEKLTGAIAYLFAIARCRAPASRKAPGANVRREGRYRVAIRYMRIAS